MNKKAETDYWEDVVGDALENVGLDATPDQIASIADDIRVSHECYSMAFGMDVASGNLQAARDRKEREMQKELDDERRKVTCRECGGSGERVTYGGTLQAISRCWKCKGQGRHLP